MLRVFTAAAMVATVATLAHAEPETTLNVGDKAPALTDVTWLRGDQANEWKSGHVYVLDFWATWCGPCVASIPHINELQHDLKSQNVHVIGVAIWPKPGMTATETFIASRDDMNYAIAADIDGKTAKAFMEAAGMNGIPTAMVIGKTGKLEWIGHPMDGLDEIVGLVVSDKFDAVAFETQAKRDREAAETIGDRMMEAMGQQRWADAVAAADELLAVNPKKFKGVNLLKYQAMVMGDNPSASALGNKIVSDLFANDSNMLNGFAWGIVEPGSEIPQSKQDVALALKAAKRASELTKDKDPSVLDTLARAYFASGDAKLALETQKLAIEHAPDRMKEELKEALAEYEAAAKQM